MELQSAWVLELELELMLTLPRWFVRAIRFRFHL